MYFVYIVTNKWNNVLYVGFTGDLGRRIKEHESGKIAGFTEKYHVNKLVYFERFSNVSEARRREKQIKAGSRDKKLRLIWATNPKLQELRLGSLFSEIASLRSQ